MSDFRIQFVTGTIPSATQTVDVNSPAFIAVEDLDRSFIIPATPHNSGCIGRTTGTFINTMFNLAATVKLIDIDTVRFDDGDAAQLRNNLCGAWLVEYIGALGGPNEVIVRAIQDLNTGNVASYDGPAISGISDITRVVPFVTMYGNVNTQNTAQHSGRVEVVNDGVNNVVRVTRGSAATPLVLRVYVVEFVGSNWEVEKVTHTFSADNTNEDETISAVVLANSFVYSTYRFSGGFNSNALAYAWLENTTTLRHRILDNPGVDVSMTSYVVSNPQMNVAVYGADPDGTSDLAATGSSPETRTVSITTVADLSSAFILGHMGSDTAAGQSPEMMTLMDFQDASTVRLRRSESNGGTEYKLQVIEFQTVIGLEIESVSDIVDGATFTITGTFGADPDVTLGGVVQTVTASDDTSITCTGVLGNLRYATLYPLIVTVDSVEAETEALIMPPANKDFVNLVPPLVQNANRIATVPDLDGTEQVEWSLVVGGLVTEVIVYGDAAFSVSPAITQFSVRVHDGVEWGSLAIQSVATPVPPKTQALSCPTETL